MRQNSHEVGVRQKSAQYQALINSSFQASYIIIHDNIWHLHSLSTNKFFKGNFECQKDIHFKTQPGPVAKNATSRPPAGN